VRGAALGYGVAEEEELRVWFRIRGGEGTGRGMGHVGSSWKWKVGLGIRSMEEEAKRYG